MQQFIAGGAGIRSPDEARNSNDLRQLIESREVEFVTVALPDMQGLLRGKYLSRGKFLGASESGLGMPPVIYTKARPRG